MDEDAEAYTPMTEAERAEGRRHAALHQAVAVVGHNGDPEDVLEAARLFEAFLAGPPAADPAP